MRVLKEIVSYVGDAYKLQPDRWRVEAAQMDTNALSAELRGREKLSFWNNVLSKCEGFGGIVGIVGGEPGGYQELLLGGVVLVLATLAIHGRPTVVLSQRVSILQEALARRQTTSMH